MSKENNMDLANTNNNEVAITLKDLTDLIEVRHNDAMKQVEKLTKEESFGVVYGILVDVKMPKGGTKKVNTYNLNKRQAIAVGAKLNNALLMKVIDRLEELEAQNNRPLTTADQIQLIAQGHVDIETRLDKIENNSRLTNQQEVALKQAKNETVYRIAGNDTAAARKFHAKVWSLFKKQFTLPRFNELPNGQFNNGLVYLRSLTLADLV